MKHMEPNDPRLLRDKARVAFARSWDNLCDGGVQFGAANLITLYTLEILPPLSTFKSEILIVDAARENPQANADQDCLARSVFHLAWHTEKPVISLELRTLTNPQETQWLLGSDSTESARMGRREIAGEGHELTTRL